MKVILTLERKTKKNIQEMSNSEMFRQVEVMQDSYLNNCTLLARLYADKKYYQKQYRKYYGLYFRLKKRCK